MNKDYVKICDLDITGYENDYVFQTIKKNNYFYEGTLLDKWKNYIKNSKTIIDIGANLGNHSLYWAINLDCKKIYAFEPFKPNFEILKDNVERNKLNNIVPINKGVGSQKSKAVVKNFDDSNYGATTLEETNDENIADVMEIVDIDSFSAENSIKQIDFIKIDTEGFEEKVLLGMKNVISKFKPIMWIEVSSETHQNVFSYLFKYNYKIIDIEGFNVLFMPRERADGLEEYKIEKAINYMFSYLEKVNVYYGNYLKSKQWIEDKNNKIKIYEKNYEELKAKNQNNLDNYLKMKANYTAEKEKRISAQEDYAKMKQYYINENNKLLELKKNYKNLENEHKVFIEKCEELSKLYVNQLNESYLLNKEEVSVLNELKGTIKRLETQNNYLKSENAEYQRKMQLIKDTFVGKILIWGYHKLKFIKSKIGK